MYKKNTTKQHKAEIYIIQELTEFNELELTDMEDSQNYFN